MDQGQLEAAAQNYGEGLAIRKRLAESDRSNTRWQRDLWVSYWNLADLAEKEGNQETAHGYLVRAYEVLSGIKHSGLHLSPEDEQYLEILRHRVGVSGP